MGKLLRVALALMLFGTYALVIRTQSLAEPSLEETRKLLQKSLTIYEIDQEIARLTHQEETIAAQISDTSEQIGKQDSKVEQTREHAGKVLRAYYMGERDSLWMLMFSAKSFSDAISVYEYLSMIVDNDHKSLTSYQEAYSKLKTLRGELETTQTELRKVKDEFLAQREKAVALQKELDEQIAAVPAAEMQTIRDQLADFTKEWQEKGVPLFRTYLQAISEAMQSLPELLTGDNAAKYLKGTTFQISDTELTEFFRSKNQLFNNLTFRFENGSFVVNGVEKDIEVGLKGHYTVENDPVNKLQFHVSELTYNGFTLPETSNRALEQEFDLGFTPSKYVKQIQVTDVTTNDGKFTISLKISLKF
ncbi:coiled-coil domain-containing protein [Paenibacillus contaminans]|uniref:Uncharacterized protein n=1 Tax=Paenibacillus contaminans TaxID=450362 RepID=A0A329MM37_9BACL|nr:hypothetical protein [Paenibacillus contaminans]RAV19773.1 hypothetical protein DQG23_17665 [Paenibacillus contaminans]